MKKISSILKYKILPLLLVAFMYGCEEVIEIDLNSADPQIVSEGTITLDSIANIRLTYTSDYFNPEGAEFITDAEITLSDNRGGLDTLKHVGGGYYRGKNIIGQENTEYHLKIIKDAKIYECTTSLGEKPDIHSIEVDTLDFGFNFDDEISMEVKINIIKGHHKGSPFLLNFDYSDINLGDDYNLISELSAKNDTLQFRVIIDELIEDDNLYISIHTIDEPIYDFFSMLNDALNANTMSSATPYNPTSNISNGMLGYFSATARSDYKVKIKTGEYYKK